MKKFLLQFLVPLKQQQRNVLKKKKYKAEQGISPVDEKILLMKLS